MENKVNNLTGKEWLKNAINFWQVEDLNPESLYKRFRDFCFKERTTGKCCKKIGNGNVKPDQYDFGFYEINDVEDAKQSVYIAALSSFNSYHIFYYSKDVIEEYLLPDFIYRLSIKYGMEYRGRIICWKKEKNDFAYCLMFLNRIERKPDFDNEICPTKIRYIEEKQHVIESKSKMDEIGLKHPAPFSYIDIEELCKLNNIHEKTVLDPFLGVGSTIIGCYKDNKCIGIELSKEYVDLIGERYALLNLPEKIKNNKIICGDSFKEIKNIESVDIVITSPPYFNILKNTTTGVRTDGSQSRQGIEYYSESEEDVGNISTYDAYLDAIKAIFNECYKKSNKNGEFYLVISDFTVNKKEKDVHSDMVRIMSEIGYAYAGTSYFRQNQKVIYPFGYPYKIVMNHIFQYVIKFKKYE